MWKGMFGRRGKSTAVAFVDYEHWFYGYSNSFQMKPNVEEWLHEVKSDFKVKNLYVFGDFSEPNIEKDLNRLKKITSGVVHTASDKTGVDKDFTDVIMLDYIYRYAARKKSPDIYILFTGDAHFLKVAEYLKELGKKVIIYGVKFGFSNQLKSVSTSYVEMPRQSQEKDHYNELILASLHRLRRKPKTLITYWKTINSVADYNKVSKDRVKTALDGLLKQKYISRHEQVGYNGKMVDALRVDWDKIERDGIWNG